MARKVHILIIFLQNKDMITSISIRVQRLTTRRAVLSEYQDSLYGVA